MERQGRRRRRRPALSCVECRRRKIKCDRSDPCGRCVSTSARCTFKLFGDDSVTSPRDPRISTVQTTPAPSPQAPLVNANAAATEQGDWPSTDPVARCQPTPNTPVAGLENAGRLGRSETGAPTSQASASTPLRLLSETGQSILAGQFGLDLSQILFNKTRTLRSSHWMGMANEFRCINSCYMAITSETTGEEWLLDERIEASIAHIRELLTNCKTITKSLKIGRPSRSLFPPLSDLIPPLDNVADNMIKLYFESFEPAMRILHTPSFWIEYKRFRESPETVKPDILFKVLLVVGLGSSVSTPDPTFRTRVQQWLYATQTWLSGPLEKDRLNIPGIQIYCLTLLARQVFAVGGDLVWMSTGSLVHRALQMGLHRDPKHLPPMPHIQAEVRRRLWATILELVVQSSLDAATPPRISLEEFDTEAPSNVDDYELSESATSGEEQPKDFYTASSMQLILLESVPTRLKILKALNDLHSEISIEDVLTLSSELSSMLHKCGQFVKKSKGKGIDSFHSNLIDYLVRRFMIPLHCAFACRARTNPMFQSSLKICVDTALTLVSPEPDEKFSRLIVVGGGLFREGIRYACSVVGLELIAETEAQDKDGTLHRISAYRNVVKQAARDLVALSAERIRQGENNVKMHMFLSMILGQVEAMEEGKEVQHRITREACEGLEFCYKLLQERASNVPLPTPNSQDTLPAVDGWRCETEFDWDTGLFMPSTVFF